MIYLYTGEGGGKTTNALGLALRSLGHKHKVVIIQFLKWWKKIGEYKFEKYAKKAGLDYKIFQFGREGWKGIRNLTEEDRKLCEDAFEFTKKIVKKEKPSLLVLDELNLVLYCNLLDTNEVIKYLKSLPRSLDVVITGRYAPKKLIEAADYANEIRILKMPKKLWAKKGVQY